jgi:hypothetical protein
MQTKIWPGLAPLLAHVPPLTMCLSVSTVCSYAVLFVAHTAMGSLLPMGSWSVCLDALGCLHCTCVGGLCSLCCFLTPTCVCGFGSLYCLLQEARRRE